MDFYLKTKLATPFLTLGLQLRLGLGLLLGLNLGSYSMLGCWLFSHQFSSASTLKRCIWFSTQKCIAQQTSYYYG